MSKKIYNYFSYVPFSLHRGLRPLNKVLTNTTASFKSLLGINYKAISIYTITAYKANSTKFKQPGIYGLYCIAEGKFYIGQAYNLKKRLDCHLQNRQSSAALQQAISKYDLNKFQIIIFNTLPTSLLHQRRCLHTQLCVLEQWFFDNVTPNRLYNTILSCSPIGTGFSLPHTAATKLKISLSSRGVKKPTMASGKNPNASVCKIVDITNNNNVHIFECHAEPLGARGQLLPFLRSKESQSPDT